MSKMSFSPSGYKEKTKEQFIADANKPKQAIPNEVVYPWQDPNLRDDVTKVYNLRFPEADLLKLKFIAERTPDSIQRFCMTVLTEAINQKIDELTNE